MFGQERLLELDENNYHNTFNEWQPLHEYLSYQKELPPDFTPDKADFGPDWQSFFRQEVPSWTDNIWLRLPIANKINKAIDLTLLLHADLLDVWYQDGNQQWQQQKGGDLRPRSLWDSRQQQPEYLSPHTIRFSLAANSSTTLFIRVGATDKNSTLQPLLCNRDFFLQHSTHYFQRTIATQSFFHGILLLMFLFPLGMFWLNKDRAYLFYAAYTLSVSVFLGYAFEFQNFSFLAEYPRLGRLLLNAGCYAFPFFYNLFLIHFLHAEGWRSDIRQRFQHFNKALFFWGGLTTLALAILSPATFKMQYASWCILPVALIGITGLIYISWQYWQSNNRLARYVAANNYFMLSGLLVSSLIFYLGAIGFFDARNSSFWGILFLEATIILQLLSFSLSLSYKGLETERERVQLKELDHLKSRFFANISHEFRTPLTLILGPVQQLKASNKISSGEQQQLGIVEKYARSLLRLVNQILELTKLEVGKMQLEPQSFDWINMVKVISYSFESAAQQKEIQLTVKSPTATLPVYLDQSKMEQVLINLLSNAIKYTPAGGKIEVHTHLDQNNQVLQLTIQDNGIGISEAEQKFIFQHFYQADHGDFTNDQPSSGIGLALTKELVQLHQGSIEVDSQRGQGTRFIVNIPLSKNKANPVSSNSEKPVEWMSASKPASTPLPSSVSSDQEEKPLILIVEDHPDIQQYIQSCLSDEYQLILANDGEAGIRQAVEQIPSLIITDVMMPGKDGFELTKTLKEHPATSHIPIIILTGKSSQESKIEGLHASADDYLTKPFDAIELQLRIKNLLDNRQKWVSHFEKSASNPKPALAIPSQEDAFIQKALRIVEAELSDENFSVEKLGKALHLDRTQLFRKLKAITGQNPSGFIRTVRLKKAYALLENRTATVGEVAFSVGFSSTHYFSRCFKEQFGQTPGSVIRPVSS